MCSSVRRRRRRQRCSAVAYDDGPDNTTYSAVNHLLKTDVETIDKEGWFSNPLGKQRNSFVSTNDIAEAAFVAIAEGPERHANKF